ncbi:hypothetical protein PFICI_09748 [Pestalotiopsis fici W106-1]|uniref:HTH CENPB-type domain-containing protein n=1 Tax=Pestalotiopsis fici (strain W106-1 / CGMCC3.15140) TaxID=1229662 RepID=W3WXS4_PESFW|nr:uncharacterized protein PFICI_09748 [Pestalotiopsis fici W106-1]ETS77686.1 hypothetical protein PFICI_09748 [Pestalotiopsis fici W106-1]
MTKKNSNLEAAVLHIQTHPSANMSRVAREYGVARQTLRSRLDRAKKPAGPGQTGNQRLSPSEERDICEYIDRMFSLNLPVRMELVIYAANEILEQGCPSEHPPRVGQTWVSRFLRRHGYSTNSQKEVEPNRRDTAPVCPVKVNNVQQN